MSAIAVGLPTAAEHISIQFNTSVHYTRMLRRSTYYLFDHLQKRFCKKLKTLTNIFFYSVILALLDGLLSNDLTDALRKLASWRENTAGNKRYHSYYR